jgi:fibronectin-binding autotransporter adhesin
MKRNTMRVRAIVALLIAVGSSRVADAATETWSGAAANWNNAASWIGPNLPPVAGDALVFDGNGNTTSSNDFAANTAFSGIGFAPTAGVFTLKGNAVLLTGDINQNAANAQTLAFTTTSTTVAAGVNIIGGGLVLDGSTSNVNVAAGGSLSLGQITFGQASLSPNVSTLNINNSVAASGLEFQTKSAGTNVVNIATGQTLTVTGQVIIGTLATSGGGNVNTNANFTGGGNLSIGGGNFFMSPGNANLSGAADHDLARADMTGLTNFTYSTGATGTGLFGVGWGTRTDAQLKLASGSNTIVTLQLVVGDCAPTGTVSGSNNNNAATSTLFLGAGTNVINTNTVTIGEQKAAGVVDWVGATGSVIIAGQAGGASTSNITVGSASSATYGGGSAQMKLAGHTANIQGGTVIIGLLGGATAGTSTTADTGALTFDTGTFTANNFQIAADTSGADANGIHASATIGTNASSTGVFTVNNSFSLGSVTTTSGGHTDQATFTLNGGTANINSDIAVIRTNTGVTLNTILTLAGGSLNLGTHNVGSFASPVKTINLSGGLLNTSGTVAGNAINVTAPLNVSGSPTLAIANLNGASGTLTNSTGQILSLPSGVTLAGDSGTAQVNGGDVDALSGSRLSPGSPTAIGTLQINGNVTLENNSTLLVKLNDSGQSDMLNASGALTLNGAVNLQIGSNGNGAIIGNTYTIANFGSLTGSETNFTVAGDGSRKTFSVVPTSTTGNAIQVLVGGTGPMSISYLGNAGATWTAGNAGPLTWQNGSSPDRFFNQDATTFDDTSTNLSDITISGIVQPASLAVNASRNYTFVGTGTIAGGGNLTKSGTGTLTLGTNNSYTGTTDIQGGSLVIGNGGTSGSIGAGNLTVSGSVVFNRSDSTAITNAINDSGNGPGSVVIKSGSVTLNGNNNYSGTTTIQSGALLKTGTRNALGSMSGGDVTIQSGGTLDIGGITASFTGPPVLFGSSKTFHIAGTGVGGVGAITNSSNAIQIWALQNVTLDADALIAGARMDLGRDTGSNRMLDLQNHTLTIAMTGSQPVFGVLAGTTVTPGNIVVSAGGFDPEGATVIPDNGGTITFNTGTFLQFFATTDGAVQRQMIFKGNNNIGSATTTNGIINSNMTLQGNVSFQAYSSGQVTTTGNNPMTLTGNISESGGSFSLTKQGVFTATLSGNNTYTGGTVVNGTGSIAITNGHALGTGPVTINAGSITTSAGFTSAMHQSALTIVSGAKLDLNDNDLIVDYATGAGAATAANIRSYLISGYNGSGWNGATGIVSTAAANDGSRLTALGYADAGDVGLTTDDGVAVPSKSVVVRYTYYGDSSLDGKVDLGNDFDLFLQGFTSTNATSWELGDYNYDGVTDMTDFGLFIDGLSQQGGSLGDLESVIAASPLLTSAQRGALLSAVPEPSTIALLSVAICAVGHRRRRS